MSFHATVSLDHDFEVRVCADALRYITLHVQLTQCTTQLYSSSTCLLTR